VRKRNTQEGIGRMPFDEILGQEGARSTLAALLGAERIPGALLFHGPWGVGKTRLAFAFARAALCETRAEGASAACEDCAACRKVRKLIHPDLRFLFPLPAGKPEETEAEESAILRTYAADPYAVIQSERSASIPIDRLRELKRQAFMSAVEGRRKVFVLREADRMIELQQNALLKVLEEPPADTHFILTTSRPQALLPTLVSRCLRVTLGPLPRSIVAERLVQERGMDPQKARFTAGMAEGSLGQAMLVAGEMEDVVQVRDRALAVLAAAEAGGKELHAAAQELSGTKDRQLVRRLARALAVWHGDLIRVRAGAPEVVNADRRTELEEMAGRLGLDRIRSRIALSSDLLEALDQNANLSIAVYGFLAGLGRPELSRGVLLPVLPPS
jgi:DNA polymerase-3 subunit delta'